MQKTVSAERMDIFSQMMDRVSLGGELMNEYGSIPRLFCGKLLYEVESHTIQMIGENNGITVTALSVLAKRTPSACSQMVRKLRKKNWVEQKRNLENNREYKLHLTEEGWRLFRTHEKFDKICYTRNCLHLNEFTDEELFLFMRIQDNLNQSFKEDVKRSRINNGDIAQ